MGAIADAINAFDKSKAEQEDIKAQLDILTELANTKLDLAKERIERELLTAGSEMTKTIPVSTVREKTSETHAYASSSANKITDTIKESVTSFIKGGADNIVNGICDLLSKGITAFLGAGEGSDDTYERMFIANEGELSLVRFDLWCWKRQALGKGIKEKLQCVSAFAGVRSIINFEKLDFPTFVNLYQQQLVNSGLPKNDMMAALKRAREIYIIMTGKNTLEIDNDIPLRNLVAFDNGFAPRANLVLRS
ncbi:MAG TPA: hypothetical protein VGJ20_03835 [Xanthobacteraceae bacterium]|jgi:hypothetical protein